MLLHHSAVRCSCILSIPVVTIVMQLLKCLNQKRLLHLLSYRNTCHHHHDVLLKPSFNNHHFFITAQRNLASLNSFTEPAWKMEHVCSCNCLVTWHPTALWNPTLWLLRNVQLPMDRNSTVLFRPLEGGIESKTYPLVHSNSFTHQCLIWRSAAITNKYLNIFWCQWMKFETVHLKIHLNDWLQLNILLYYFCSSSELQYSL